jgi:hypothetical protein
MAIENAMQSLWDWIKGRAVQDAPHLVYHAIPKASTDLDYNDAPLVPQNSYFRIWLCEMYLTRSRAWFVDQIPAVHCAVQLNFGAQDQTLSSVAQLPEKLQEGILLNHRMIDLLPFNGGTVNLQATLLALKGTNHLQTAIKVLQDFSGLITAPVGQALDIAEMVSKNIEELVGGAGAGGSVHLPLSQTFAAAGGGGGNPLRPGYLVAILATGDQVDTARLRVQQDRLYYADAAGANLQPFSAADYMLIRIEGRADRDDWRFKPINDAINKAIEASIQEKDDDAEMYRRMALTLAFTSPDLAVLDRRRVVTAIKDELKNVQDQARGIAPAAAAAPAPDLKTIMESRAMPVARAAALGPITLEEVFAP